MIQIVTTLNLYCQITLKPSIWAIRLDSKQDILARETKRRV